MENQTSKIVFYKSRSLAGRFSAAFDFIENNFKVLAKFSSFIILPVAVLLSLFFTQFTFAEGLKKVDYKNQTTESEKKGSSEAAPSLSPEQTKQLMDQVEDLKKKQVENQKFMDELENDE